MIKKIHFLALVSLTVIFTNAQTNTAALEYIKTYRNIAVREMQRTGVPASIKLAQGLFESMSGQSDLAQRSNNHFGIKCKTGYTGPYVLHDDDRPNERFIKYDNPEQSFIDHSDFLRRSQRYAFLFELDPANYRGWAYGLKKAGYATNPQYPEKIIKIIEDYNLQDYTLIASGKKPMPGDMQNYAASNPPPKKPQYPVNDFRINGTRVIFVKKGTPYANIAEQYDIALDRLYDYNDIKSRPWQAMEYQLVYLQLKRTVGENKKHLVADGETINSIAQSEGIRLESLLKYNDLTKFSSPAIGTELYLQEPASTTGPIANN